MTPRLKLLFTASICFNILLVGIILGHSYKRLSHENHEQMQEFKQSLPSEKASLLRSSMKELHQSSRAIKQGIKATQKEMIRVLTAKTFDAEKYQTLSDSITAQRTKLMDDLSQNTKNLATEFTQDERKALATRLQRSMKGDRKGRKRGDRQSNRDTDRHKSRNSN
jgi:uncharacterized membrane protein